MKLRSKRPTQLDGEHARPKGVELCVLSTSELAVTCQMRPQGGYLGNVDRRGFMS